MKVQGMGSRRSGSSNKPTPGRSGMGTTNMLECSTASHLCRFSEAFQGSPYRQQTISITPESTRHGLPVGFTARKEPKMRTGEHSCSWGPEWDGQGLKYSRQDEGTKGSSNRTERWTGFRGFKETESPGSDACIDLLNEGARVHIETVERAECEFQGDVLPLRGAIGHMGEGGQGLQRKV